MPGVGSEAMLYSDAGVFNSLVKYVAPVKFARFSYSINVDMEASNISTEL